MKFCHIYICAYECTFVCVHSSMTMCIHVHLGTLSSNVMARLSVSCNKEYLDRSECGTWYLVISQLLWPLLLWSGWTHLNVGCIYVVRSTFIWHSLWSGQLSHLMKYILYMYVYKLYNVNTWIVLKLRFTSVRIEVAIPVPVLLSNDAWDIGIITKVLQEYIYFLSKFFEQSL